MFVISGEFSNNREVIAETIICRLFVFTNQRYWIVLRGSLF